MSEAPRLPGGFSVADDRIDLDHLKSTARDLQAAARRGEAEAITRLHAVAAAPGRSGDRPALADCLHAIAREHGFASWPELKREAEVRRADGLARRSSLASALILGRLRQARRILELKPSIAERSPPLQLALYDEAGVEAALARGAIANGRPDIEAGDVRFEPLARLCTSQYFRLRPDLIDAQTRIARRLLALGADPNQRYSTPEDRSLPMPLLYGTLCVAGNLGLTALLLEAGADPNDGECAYHAAEMPTHDALRLLIRHGVRFPGTNALLRKLDFDDFDGAVLMLDHGADATEGLQGNALHHAVRRGRDGRFAELLVARGADPRATSGGHDAHGLALMMGNGAMAEALERLGAGGTPTPTEAFVAALARPDRRAALEIAAAHPGILERLPPAERRLHIAFARQPGRLETLRLMQEFGFDPDATDGEGLTALHAAAWFGQAGHVAFYLGLGPDLERRNGYGGTVLGTAIHGSAHCPPGAGADHAAVVRLLIDAGALIRPEDGHLDGGSDAVAAIVEAAAEIG